MEFQSMSETRLVKCPSCSKPSLKRLIGGGTGVIFKGSGFYSTDYKSKSGEKSDKKDAAPCAACQSAKDNGGACPAKS
jgi:predicted nucleic acid-binding Zn ribbon protein